MAIQLRVIGYLLVVEVVISDGCDDNGGDCGSGCFNGFGRCGHGNEMHKATGGFRHTIGGLALCKMNLGMVCMALVCL